MKTFAPTALCRSDIKNGWDMTEEIKSLFEEKADNSLIAKIKDLLHLKSVIKEFEERLKKLKADYVDDEALLFNAMDAQDIQNISINGHNFYRRTDVYSSVVDEQKAFAWLSERGYGEIIKKSVNTRTLSAVVKEVMEEEGTDAVPDCIKVHTKNKIGIRIRKSK